MDVSIRENSGKACKPQFMLPRESFVGKPTVSVRQVKCILLFNIIDILMHYQNTCSDKITDKRWLGLLFHTAFSWPCNTLRSQCRWCGTSGGL